MLAPAVTEAFGEHVISQQSVVADDRTYRLDFLLTGSRLRVAVELDGFAFHSSKAAFVYDRVRQNDLTSLGFAILRFSYDAIRDDTRRCVAQLQAVLRRDPTLAHYVVDDPLVPIPNDMAPNPLWLATPPERTSLGRDDYFHLVRQHVDLSPLRACQHEAMIALVNYYRRGGINAACVMSVGAGKTALGVAAALAFTRRRALIVTPGRVIRGTFATALDPTMAGNALYTLRGGPLIAGCRPPRVNVLDSDGGPIREVSRDTLLAAEIIVTNFHALGTGGVDDLLSKLGPDEIDFIVVDEAHIAAAESYQRLFARFPNARRLLMSACFTRADGKTISADVVYRYRLIDSIADGHAKHLRAHRFTPDVEQTTYEIIWPDGNREVIVSKSALLDVMRNERKLARITAMSEEPIHRIMTIARRCLDDQTTALSPIRPRILFAALGQSHAEQIARVANAHGIACGVLHHTMTESTIAATRARFESESGNLQGIVQLKMLGQGYDLPAISLIVPMRPYGSFGEFYQFIGRGIRVIQHPALTDTPQHLDVIYHGELGLDDHLETLRLENDMDPHPADADTFGDAPIPDKASTAAANGAGPPDAANPDAIVLAEYGDTNQQFLHDIAKVEARRDERELHALAQRYAAYAESTSNPRTFDEFVSVIRSIHG
ncbi:DEAD/DEAH box helicase family protein [Longispora sp. NPDC051575]|uniref:DEAD/DEAH box helicase family protein n=1 Tax=Longispora sp. NPDC051575 TaxID=3154943 RepID=UPI00341FD13A